MELAPTEQRMDNGPVFSPTFVAVVAAVAAEPGLSHRGPSTPLRAAGLAATVQPREGGDQCLRKYSRASRTSERGESAIFRTGCP